MALTAIGLRALTDREAAVAIASPTGGGEAWTASWRWWQHRPKLAFGFDSASPFGGVWGVSIFGERQSYQTASAVTEETRQRAEFHVSNWTTFGLRWEGTIALDRIGDPKVESRRRALALDGALQERFANDRALVEIRAGSWAGQIDAWTLTLRSEWRSKARNEGSVALARIEESVVASDAPLALWPGAGTGQGREGLLRAHPLLDDGIIRNATFGRTLIDGGVEGRHWIQPARTPLRSARQLSSSMLRVRIGASNRRTSVGRSMWEPGCAWRFQVQASFDSMSRMGFATAGRRSRWDGDDSLQRPSDSYPAASRDSRG